MTDEEQPPHDPFWSIGTPADPPPAPPTMSWPGDAPAVEADAAGTVDVADLSYDQRDIVTQRLTSEGVEYRWERGVAIVVAPRDESFVRSLVAELVGQRSVPLNDEVPVANEEIVAEAPLTDFVDPEPDEIGPSADSEIIPDPVALGDETEFDLVDLSSEERRHLTMRLTGAGINHRWEVGTDLIVSSADADLIESFIDEVQNPDGFNDEELDDYDEEVDDEAVYTAMSNLYVAADKLMQRVGDGPTRNEFFDASDDVEGLPAPFGFDPRVWTKVLDLAASIADTMDREGDDDAIAGDARTLRELLVNYV